jgi:rhodanese-related sulfurtransferase
MKSISREDLKQKLDHKENFRLVMALADWAYEAKHIPESIHFSTMKDALQSLDKDDEIVVYCSDENCIASTALGQLLERNGYSRVLHYSGGLQDWEQAGYPLEGTWVKP